MVFTINGVDMIPYIAHGGIRWSRNDVEAAGAGRVQEDGNMQRDRVAIKYRFDITCRPLRAEELATVLTAIEPVYLDVTYTDPTTNTVKTGQFYSNNFPATFCIMNTDGTEWWNGLAFPVIQV